MSDPKFKEITELETILNFTENLQNRFVTSNPTTKVQTIINNLICQILNVRRLTDLDDRHYKTRKKWIEEGINCERLNPGDPQWKKGKVRVRVVVEFAPDEPESPDYQSPLDEIRQEMQDFEN
ncbi:MAG: KGK domain-containing protein [Synechocystis sp.]